MLSAIAIAARGNRAQDEDEDEEGGEDDRADHDRDPFLGHFAEGVERGRATGDAGLQAGLSRPIEGGIFSSSFLFSAIEPGEFSDPWGSPSASPAMTPVFEVDPFGRRVRAARRWCRPGLRGTK